MSSYIVTKKITKPAGVEWFIDYDPVTWVKIDEWNQIIDGLTNSYVETINENEVVFTLVWSDQSKYEAYLVDRLQIPEWVARDTYNTENNIVTVVTLPSEPSVLE